MTSTDPVIISGKAQATKLDAIEWIRVVSAVGVVWFHVPGGGHKDLGHAGLIAFILIAVVFQANGAAIESPRLYFRKKFLRLVPSWTFWFAVYASGNLVRGRELFPYTDGALPNLLAGPWIGLWFLPFVLLSSAGVFLLIALGRNLNSVVFGAGVLATGLMLLVFYPALHDALHPVAPWAQWLHAAPAPFLGASIWFALTSIEPLRRPTLISIVLMVLAACVILGMNGEREIAIHYGVAILATGIGFGFRFRLWRGITSLGNLCLGVYLTHFIFMTVLGMMPFPGKNPLPLFAGTLLLSFVTTALLRQSRHFRHIC